MKVLLVAIMIFVALTSAAGATETLPQQCLDVTNMWQAVMVSGTQTSGANLIKISQQWTALTLSAQTCNAGYLNRISVVCMSNENGAWYYFPGGTGASKVSIMSPIGIPIQVTASGHCVKSSNNVYLPFAQR